MKAQTKMLVEPIKNGVDEEMSKRQVLFDLAHRLREEANPYEAKRLGRQLGRLVFGGLLPKSER